MISDGGLRRGHRGGDDARFAGLGCRTGDPVPLRAAEHVLVPEVEPATLRTAAI
jgi:hypothetical protein